MLMLIYLVDNRWDLMTDEKHVARILLTRNVGRIIHGSNWYMLLLLPLDYWETIYFENATTSVCLVHTCVSTRVKHARISNYLCSSVCNDLVHDASGLLYGTKKKQSARLTRISIVIFKRTWLTRSYLRCLVLVQLGCIARSNSKDTFSNNFGKLLHHYKLSKFCFILFSRMPFDFDEKT